VLGCQSHGSIDSSPLKIHVVVTMPNNRPTICTADGANCVGITGRVHWDVGGYDYRPNTAATVPQKLDSGENVRRARIGLAGKFFNDWNFALIYDFGGSSDGFGGTGAAGATPVGFLPGGGTSGIENAYISYTGLKPFGGKMAIEAGIMDLAWTMDESMSSNDLPFMERASVGVIAQNIAAGDFRSAVGARWYNDSKATTPHAAITAIRGFDHVVLLAGGRNKGLDLAGLAEEHARVKAVVALGEAAPIVRDAFAKWCEVVEASSMSEAVAAAARLASPGDTVLLSPACASFDWYPDGGYPARGDDFKRLVHAYFEEGGQ